MTGSGGTSRRYPGAPPFGDDELSRKLFCGRGLEARELADVVLAQRLVVVYARSGMGKSSLINAGLKELLWTENVLPIPIRLNDGDKGPLVTLYEGVEQAVKDRSVEHVRGTTVTLWHFFKTSEFWRGDTLLTPLLILDQFEELFTLQSADPREAFIAQLAGLIRGVRPAGALDAGSQPLSHAPPSIKVLISLREDYLGHLEELSTAIPEILDNRFRLGPLLEREARQAIVGPARLDDARLTSKPFEYAPEALHGIWTYLSRHLPGQAVMSRPYVEPFQLQLVCQRAEEIALDAQRASTGSAASPVTITWDALGRDAGLRATLASFYERQIASLPPQRSRRAVRRLCEYGLISVSGRRLSLEEGEIQRTYRLPKEALTELVERRLLRADTRVASVYYELSHDTLVEPILEARRHRESRRTMVKRALALVVAIATLGPVTLSALSWQAMRRSLAADLRWVRVPAPPGGRFWMGCVPNDEECHVSEQPRHAVPLPHGFEMMANEVTVDQFRRFVAASSGTLVGRWLPGGGVHIEPQPKGSKPDHPVVYVDWGEAVVFCRFGGGRLPTEAEWEYAARGGAADAVYPWGSDYSGDYANGVTESGHQRDQWEETAPVKSFPPNPFGLYDMVGNVWEWTSTLHEPYPYRRDDGREDPKSREARVVRGGGFVNLPRHLRASIRKADPPHAGDFTLGFRCARD